MQLGAKPTLEAGTVQEFAAACAEGPEALRELLAPLLPTLYTFVARRTEDANEAESVLVDALVCARSDARRFAGSQTPLLGWLLRQALQTLRVEQETDGPLDISQELPDHHLREAGFLPNEVVPSVPAPPWTFETLTKLPERERLALGMRFGDGLPVRTIAVALDTDEATVQTAVETGVRALQETCCPDKRLSRITAAGYDAYVTSVLDGVDGDPPAEIGPGMATLTRSLAATRSPRGPSDSKQASVWQRFQSDREQVLTSSLVPPLARWIAPVLLVAGLLLSLVAVSLWLIYGRGEQRPDSPALSRSTAVASNPSSSGAVAARAAELEAARPRSAMRFAGRVFFTGRHGGSNELWFVDMSELDVQNRRQPRLLARLAGANAVYAVSPSGGRVAYADGGTIWVRGLGPGRPVPVLQLTLGGKRSSARTRRASTERVTALAWHPHGDRIAVASSLAEREHG
ncbi:MAG: hypothetical protein M3281_03675 [Chloroflexota bacterium]|nr:hypothetical protein [Chloroflexota bacterium]